MRTFFVTGAASGIGRALAKAIVDRGDRVVAVDIAHEVLEETARNWPEHRTLVRKLDIRDCEQWDQVFEEAEERLGDIDVLINVAGTLVTGEFWKLSADEVQRHLDVNVRGTVLGTQTAARRMMRRGRGHIINFSSIAALAPIPGLAMYSASKYAVRSFSQASAYELRPHGVAVTTVCPDAVKTPMFDQQLHDDAAALSFSGPNPMPAEKLVEHLLGPVLRDQPLEVWIPRARCLLAFAGGVLPELGQKIIPHMMRFGRWRQKRARRATTMDGSMT